MGRGNSVGYLTTKLVGVKSRIFQFTWLSHWWLAESAEPPKESSGRGRGGRSTSLQYNNTIIIVIIIVIVVIVIVIIVVGGRTFRGCCSAVRRHPSSGGALNGGTFDGGDGTGYFSRVRHPIFRSDGHLSRPLVGRVENEATKRESHSRCCACTGNSTGTLHRLRIHTISCCFHAFS